MASYSPLESTGKEWYRHGDPYVECIYQEYSDSEATTLDFIRSSRINASLIDASLPEENEETRKISKTKIEQWLGSDPDHPLSERFINQCTLELSISWLTATIIGSIYMLVSYLYFKTASNCEFHLKRSIPIHVQWMRTISDAIANVFIQLFQKRLLLWSMMRDAWSMFHTTRHTNVDSYCEREFQAGNK